MVVGSCFNTDIIRMVFFPKLGPVSRRKKVEDQLDRVAVLFVAKALYHLFRRTVEGLLANKYV